MVLAEEGVRQAMRDVEHVFLSPNTHPAACYPRAAASRLSAFVTALGVLPTTRPPRDGEFVATSAADGGAMPTATVSLIGAVGGGLNPPGIVGMMYPIRPEGELPVPGPVYRGPEWILQWLYQDLFQGTYRHDDAGRPLPTNLDYYDKMIVLRDPGFQSAVEDVIADARLALGFYKVYRSLLPLVMCTQSWEKWLEALEKDVDAALSDAIDDATSSLLHSDPHRQPMIDELRLRRKEFAFKVLRAKSLLPRPRR
jgi:hypothetical protein